MQKSARKRAATIAGHLRPRHLTPQPTYGPISLASDLAETGKFIFDGLNVLWKIRRGTTTADFLEQSCDAHPDHLAMIDADSGASFTFQQVEAAANRVAHWALGEGLLQGDVVALFMENRPEYIWLWLGLAKIGCITALINSGLRGRSLVHCISIAKASRVVVGPAVLSAVSEVTSQLPAELTWLCWVGGSQYEDELPAPVRSFDAAIASKSEERIERSVARGILKPWDLCWYIYTSGTTGLPKAARINHTRLFSAGLMYAQLYGVAANDRIYCTLPLYHSAGGNIGVGLSWYCGAPLVLRSKFSASNFWADCIKYECTVIQYIGELCRYLLNTPQQAAESQHKVRLAIGNGLRPDIWEQFRDRFRIRQIGEFYAATEGTFALFNTKNKVGAIGYLNWLVAKLYPMRLVKFDLLKEEPVRIKGWCIPCGPGEVGEALSEIKENASTPAHRFEGYKDRAGNEKKLLRNVFVKGDCYFRSGDLMKYDDEGFYYFVDRIGDTFRWKGENIATTEVAAVLGTFAGALAANVYWVAVPRMDGRAGMAAIVLQEGAVFDPVALFSFVKKELQAAAAPAFVRLQQGFGSMTGTMKFIKTEYVRAGFDPKQVPDQIYFRDDAAAAYVDLTAELYLQICSGERKF